MRNSAEARGREEDTKQIGEEQNVNPRGGEEGNNLW